MPAFQLIADQFTDGLFGTDAFGTSAFGGPDYPPVQLDLDYPGDDLSFDGTRRIGEVVHRRNGLIVGSRTYATVRTWLVSMHLLTQTRLDEIRAFWQARKFYLLQDDDETGRKVAVFWPGDFTPKHKRGGYYDLEFRIEEVLE